MNDMQDTTASESQPVFRLIYRSHSVIAEEDRATGLGEIFTTARRKNKRSGVTGALMISGDSFVQTLEGEEAVVRELYATISQDPRHDGLSILQELDVEARTFGRWAMAKVADGDGPDIRLLSNAEKGVIVAAPGRDPSVTPEQKAVLAFMRSAIALDALET